MTYEPCPRCSDTGLATDHAGGGEEFCDCEHGSVARFAPGAPEPPTSRDIGSSTQPAGPPSEPIVPAVETLIEPAQMLAAFASCWRDALGIDYPHRESLLVLLAHWALETGRGRYMKCWNLGNAKARAGDGHRATYYRCDEILPTDYANHVVAASNGLARLEWARGGKAAVEFLPNHPFCRFRAFLTLEEGVVDYLRTVRGNFGHAWPGVEQGDPALFCHLLKEAGYYTADEGPYAAGVASLFREFADLPIPDRRLDEDVARPAPPPDEGSVREGGNGDA